MILSNKFALSRLAKLFFLLFLISIFFPIRYVVPTASSYATGLFSDFTSISLYSSDIFLFIAFFFILWYNYKYFIKIFSFPHILAIFWLILLVLLQYKSISGLNIWFLIKFLEISVVSYGTTAILFSQIDLKTKHLFFLLLVSLGTLQACIALLQFINQSSVGLNLIGEQVIGPSLWGVGKIVSDGTTYIRGYGTFPHPNPLSAFLVASIFANIYLLNSTTWKKSIKIWLNLALFINVLGLTTAFSRGAFLALGIGLLVYFGLLIIKQGIQGNTYTFLKVFLACGIAFLIFKPFLFSRATVSDQAIVERGIYNQTALKMIKDKPFTGVGIGESVLHMEQYSPVPLNPWQIQPIHNFFLLSAAELGIIGAVILIWILLSHLKSLIYILKSKFDPYFLLLTSIFISFLVLMMFDHYFYTLQPTQMLLWIILGLIAAETKKSPQN